MKSEVQRSSHPRLSPLVARKMPSGKRSQEITLRLYIAATTPNSQRARTNLQAALQNPDIGPDYKLEVIDVLADAKRAVTDNVIVTPTLVALGPKLRLVMIGDLSDAAKLRGLLKDAADLC
jgi:hypothetical protein